MTDSESSINEYSHFNPPEMLAPVGCKLALVGVDGVFFAIRTGHIESKDREMEYILESGDYIYGRYWWTYP